MAEMGHYTHVDQLRDRLDYYLVGSFPEEKLRALQLEDPMGGMIIKYLEEQILPEEKRMRERVYKSENNFLIDENSHLFISHRIGSRRFSKRLLFSSVVRT